MRGGGVGLTGDFMGSGVFLRHDDYWSSDRIVDGEMGPDFAAVETGE